MDEDLTLLNDFNELAGEQATIYGRNYIYDTDGAYSVGFYRLCEGLDSSTGICKLKYLGVFNGGRFFDEVEPEKSGFVLSSRDSIIEGYPMSKDTISVGQFRVEYRSTHICTDIHNSLLPFPRYWESDFEVIKLNFPEEAQKISELLDQRISYLAKIQASKGYKSAWVYYRFLEKSEFLTSVINGNILRNTCYFFCPEVYYNKYSSRVMSMSVKERAELHRNHVPNWNRWD
ncbi:hypothetical protein [Photobacterium minamisatsumaniensis]|uniref:hypothetical protein n=1 Tax=Photobacterium minamisatsumaniensis TaxID=2910233 RepID=UPI003D149117